MVYGAFKVPVDVRVRRPGIRVDFRPQGSDNLTEGGMPAPPRAVATRNFVLTTAKALAQALCQAEFDTTATDSAPFFSRTR